MSLKIFLGGWPFFNVHWTVKFIYLWLSFHCSPRRRFQIKPDLFDRVLFYPTKAVRYKRATCFGETWNVLQTWKTCYLLCNVSAKRVEKRCCAFYHLQIKPVLLLFAIKSIHVARFTGPRQPCFAACDVNPVYSVILAQSCPIRSQYSRSM